MNAEKFTRALGKVDDKYVMEAISFRRDKSRVRVKWGAAAAACLCILGIGVQAGRWLGGQEGSQEDRSIGVSSDGNAGAIEENGDMIDVAEEGVRIPKMQVKVQEGASACMIPFFIYQGRSYVGDEMMEASPDLAGEYLGTATGSLDAWSGEEEYVELSGSIGGDFYSVEGYDPDFLLGIEQEDGLWLFINDNGITLKNGRELFEDRLHLAGRYGQVQYQTREDWYYSQGGIRTLEGAEEALDDFVAALSEAPFQRLEDIPLEAGAVSVYDEKEIYHMYFTMEDGIVIHLRLFEGGYVQFAGIRGVCVRLEGEEFGRIVERMAEG